MVEEATQGKKVSEASIELANASQARANADLVFAAADRDRNAKLVESNSVSKAEYELSVTRYAEALASVNQANASLTQSRSSVELADAKIDQASLQLADAKYDLEQTTIYRTPPWTIGDRIVTVESATTPGVETELLIKAKHTTIHRDPETIAELKRILREHAQLMTQVIFQSQK